MYFFKNSIFSTASNKLWFCYEKRLRKRERERSMYWKNKEREIKKKYVLQSYNTFKNYEKQYISNYLSFKPVAYCYSRA